MPRNDVPDPVARSAHLMSGMPAHWALCGGWAVDAWLGHQTREHGDVDISIFHDEQRAVFDHLVGWQLIAHDPQVEGDSAELWDGRHLDLPAHIHGKPYNPDDVLPDRLRIPEKEGFELDIQLDERAGEEWIFSREPRVVAPLVQCVGRSSWELPTLAPVAILFYKARENRPRDNADLLALLPGLGRWRTTMATRSDRQPRSESPVAGAAVRLEAAS